MKPGTVPIASDADVEYLLLRKMAAALKRLCMTAPASTGVNDGEFREMLWCADMALAAYEQRFGDPRTELAPIPDARPTPPTYVFSVRGRRAFVRGTEGRGGGRRDESRGKEFP